MKSEIKKFLLTCPLALATLIITSSFAVNSLLCFSLILVVSILMLCIEWNSKNIIFFLAVCISGPIAEAIAIYAGVWTYTTPWYIGIPLWLPLAWGNAGLYIMRLKSLINSFSRTV